MSVQGVPVPGIVPRRQDGVFDGHVAFALWKMLRDQAAAINRIGTGEVVIPDPFPPGRFDQPVADVVSSRLRAHAQAINRLGGTVEVPGVVVPSKGDVFDEPIAAAIARTLQRHAHAINSLAA